MFRLIKFAAVPAVLLAAFALTGSTKAQAGDWDCHHHHHHCGPNYNGYYQQSYYPSYGYSYNVYRPPVYGYGAGFRYPYRQYGFPTGTYGFYRW